MTTEPRAPRAIEMVSLVALAAGVVALVFGSLAGGAAVRLAVAVASAAAVLLGWPMVFWLLDQGRVGSRVWIVAGVLMGGLPLLLAPLSGVLGLYLRHADVDLVRHALELGAPIPWFGVIDWPRFVRYELAAIAAGIVTAAVQWRLFVRR